MNRRDQIVATIETITALPPVAVQMIPLLQNPDASLKDITQRLSHDPGLTANTLRLANCSMHAARQPIVQVGDAIKRLGTRRVLGLIIGSSVAPIARTRVKGYDLAEGELWRHAVAVAIGTEELAAVLGVCAPPHAFTAGLLADIGKVVLGTFLAVDAQRITTRAFDNGIPFDQAEREVLGIDHAEVGAMLMAHWKLPADIVDVVRWHHLPDQCASDRSVVGLVHVADHICALSGIGAGVDGLNYQPSRQVLEDLKVSTDTIERTLCGLMERLEHAEALLAAPAGSA